LETQGRGGEKELLQAKIIPLLILEVKILEEK